MEGIVQHRNGTLFLVTAAATSPGFQTFCLRSRSLCDHPFIHGMPQRCSLIGSVAVATGTGSGGVTTLGTGRGCYNGLIMVYMIDGGNRITL